MENSFTLVLAMIFCLFAFGYDNKEQATKARRNTWVYIKVKIFCTAKETISKMKRESTEYEDIFENHLYDISLKYIRNS